MKYYVTADTHGYFEAFHAALEEKGFFADPEPHKLIVCGDLFDRGTGAKELQGFFLDLMEKDQVILIRGNHEDLALELLSEWDQGAYLYHHHLHNRTVDTVCQLTGAAANDFKVFPLRVRGLFQKTPYIQAIIPEMLDYYETKHFVFTHGWIPCTRLFDGPRSYRYIKNADWRNASREEWSKARWYNGMEAAHQGVIEPGKTVVCGHWHCSYGHARFEGRGGEFDDVPVFDPYYGDGIIALDACTAVSGKVNCIVLADDEME